MSATYPSGIKSYAALNPGDVILDTDTEAAYDEITAIETALINGFAHDLKFTDATYDIGKSGATRPRDLFLSRNAVVGGTLGVTGVATFTVAPVFTAGIGTLGSGAVGAPSVAVGAATVGIYSSGANALDFATNGVKALGIDSTQFIDSPTQPRCVAFNSAGQSIASTSAVLTMDSEDLDVGAMHSTSSNTNRITVPAGGDGLYLVHGQCLVDTGVAVLQIRKNGSAVGTAGYSTSSQLTLTATAILVLAAADYVELFGTASGTTVVFGNASRQYAVQLSVVKLW